MGSSIVFVLALLTYNSTTSSFTKTKEMSWHLSLSECRTVLTKETTQGRKPYFNENYACFPVKDARLAAVLRQNRSQPDYPIRHGSNRLMLKW